MVESYPGVLFSQSIGGVSELEFGIDAMYSFEDGQEEGAPAARFGGNAQGVKMSGKIDFNLFSDLTTDIRISHLDLSAAGLGGVDLMDPYVIASLYLGIKFQHNMNPGAGQLWAVPTVADGLFEGRLTLGIDADEAPSLLVDMLSATYGDRNKVLTFTIGGVSYSVPMRMKSGGVPVKKGGRQEYTLQLADRSARAGVTVLPSTSTTLIGKAINDPKTALAFEFQPKDDVSINFSGSMVWDSMGLSIEDGKLVPVAMSFLTQGEVVAAATS